ncbi:MAG: UDP-N-acetylmuramoyl-L-alanine--D-glutamate ligase [Oligoflexia bacterium]|nr:UDP-N-acetylmuramoyl-L-alanine--D-glutamate ligase [Oligoflexia bacterium]
MERLKNKKVLIVGIGKTGFALINFFNKLECEIKVTDIKPIFELNKAVKRLKKIRPAPEMTFGEHRVEDFLDSDVIVYGASVSPSLPQLEEARNHGKKVYSQFELAATLCDKPIVAVCGSYGRTTVAHMIGYTLKLDGLNAFVCGTGDNPFINLWVQGLEKTTDYVVVEISVLELQQFKNLKPKLVVFTPIGEQYPSSRFKNFSDFIETKISIVRELREDSYLVLNYDKLINNALFKNLNCQTYWYSRKSFINMGVNTQVQGTHFHDKRIHSNIHCHSEFIVSKMRIIGENNRENLLASITACKALKVSDKSIQTCIEKFPGIPHRLEFVMEKNGVCFYNDSKTESMQSLVLSLSAFKSPVILIAGGKETDQHYDQFFDAIKANVRVLVLVGESKEKMNRLLGDSTQTFLVGSFEESILIAYQKSRTGDIILLSPGNKSTDIFRDYEERGNYFKKLVYQL